jgi:DNA mismatch repair ATPase MutS
MAIEAWRTRHGQQPRGWLRVLGEFEALSALATYAAEHEADAFPTIDATAPLVEARELGHPLLDRRTCVRNDVSLSSNLRLLIVSGSNMSGKSTLLRALGVNAVLALAGAPVCAASMRISPIVIGASIRSRDSLQEGISRFYAEVTRLRTIKSLAEEHGHVLFLIDELLQGTNSHDRRIGAEAVLRRLLELGGIGLITTHDLALSQMAEHLAPLAANIHFEDEIVDGRMRFDYKLRPGVVRNSNAIEWLRGAGLV